MKINKSLFFWLSTLFFIISCTSSDSKFVGTWETTIKGHESRFTVANYGESFVFDGYGFGGTFTKAKEGNLLLEYGFGFKITVLYDSKADRLIWSTPYETRYCSRVKEHQTK